MKNSILMCLMMTTVFLGACKTKKVVSEAEKPKKVEKITDEGGRLHEMNKQVATPPQDKKVISSEELNAKYGYKNKAKKDGDCFNGRAKVGQFSGEGIIVYVVNLYMIEAKEGRRFYPCNLEEEFHREGMKVYFEGDRLEIYDNERLAGTPFKLSGIRGI